MKRALSDKLVAIVYKEGRQWVSQCLNVDVASCGKTSQAALKNLREALTLYFDEPRRPRSRRIERRQVLVKELQHAEKVYA